MSRRQKEANMISRYIKDTIGNAISRWIPLDADLGYLGIKEYHANSFIPVKSSKNRKPAKREKACQETGRH
jgi:hypothetical protein